MSSALPWMPLHVGDYVKDTMHLSAAESGAYMFLIMDYWTKGKLPDDERQLTRIARMSQEEWAESRGVLAAFFHDGWKHKRIDEEIIAAREKYAKRAAAGKKGGEAKAAKSAPSNAKPLLGQGHKPGLSNVHKNIEELESDDSNSTPPPPKGGGEIDSDFLDWYAAYPRHESKGQARKAYRSARRKTDAAALMVGARLAHKRFQKPFIPLPASWLTGERWLDEDTVQATGPPTALNVTPLQSRGAGNGRTDHHRRLPTEAERLDDALDRVSALLDSRAGRG